MMVLMTTKFGCFAACSSGKVAGNNSRGPRALTLKWSLIACMETSVALAKSETMPEFAMTLSMWSMFSSLFRCWTASVSELLSTLTVMTLLPLPAWREFRDCEDWLDGSRTAAMTVLFGRKRNVSTRPRPMPKTNWLD